MFRSRPLDADFVVEVLGSPISRLPAAVEALVDRAWKEEKRLRGDDLFNGKVLSLVRYTPQRLTLQPTDYRHFLAQLRMPDLAPELGIRPLAVNGVLTCGEGIVLGCRSQSVTQDAGRWELAPAGGLDGPDAYAQLLQELREELGMVADRLTACRAIGLLEDLTTGVLDIVFDLQTPLTAVELRAAHAASPTSEYSDLAVVPLRGLPSYLTEHDADLVPALVPMLRMAGLPP